QDQEPAPFRVCRPTFPRCAGEGTALSARWNSCCRFPRKAGEAPPNGGDGGALDLALCNGSRSKAFPLPGLSTHLPPLRGGRDGSCRADLETRAVASPAQRGKRPQMGVKGALWILLHAIRIKIKSPPPFGSIDPPSPTARGKGRQLSR